MGFFDALFADPGKSTAVPAGFCKASHILLTGEDAAKRAAELGARITAGELTFAEAAAAFSECPSKGKGGDLAIFNSLSRVNFLPYVEGADLSAFDAHVFSASTPIGEVTTVTTSVGTHIVNVEARN